MFDKKVVFLVTSAIIITGGLATGYYFTNNSDDSISKNIPKISQASNIQNIENKVYGSDMNLGVKDHTTKDTKIIYEYNYVQDKITRKKEQPIPTELINKDVETIEKVFSDCSIKSFDKDKIILQKNITDNDATDYILKNHNGFIAVFYNDGTDEKLKEVTKTPISSLPSTEQEILKKGISIKGNKNLLKILQDYES